MGTPKRRAVFLDRDGVLDESFRIAGVSVPPRSLIEFHLIDGVAEALDMLRKAGFILIVVTNQPDVARGKQRVEVVESMNEKLRAELPVDEILTCFHDDVDMCECRKPEPGMLNDAINRHGIDPTLSFMVGDRWRDITAGKRAGCTTILVGPDWDAQLRDIPDLRARNLREASDIICASETRPENA